MVTWLFLLSSCRSVQTVVTLDPAVPRGIARCSTRVVPIILLPPPWLGSQSPVLVILSRLGSNAGDLLRSPGYPEALGRGR